MALRHNVKNDPWALAFGRNKLRQLRDTLFDDEPRDEHYVSRRYAINGRIIRVRIAGEDEFVWSQRVAAPQPPVGDWVLLATATRSLATEFWSIELGPLIAADVMGSIYSDSSRWVLYFGNGEVYSPADPPPMESVIRIVDQATGELISSGGLSFVPDAAEINWELNYEGSYQPGTVFEIYARPGLYGTYIGD